MTKLMENVLSQMKRLGISQAKLAEAIGKSRSTVNGWFIAEYEPKTLEAVKIAEALNTTVEYLVTGESTPQKSPIRTEFDRYIDRFSDDEITRAKGMLELAFPEKKHASHGGTAVS